MAALPHQKLIDTLTAYQACDANEQHHVDTTLALLHKTHCCFLRSDFPAHVVANAWLVSPDGDKVLLMYHRFLDRWLPFGGHADGSANLLNVAMRETQEESGIEDILPQRGAQIFDVDVHDIPANPLRNEPAHQHHCVTYLVRALDEQFYLRDSGVVALHWYTPEELDGIEMTTAMRRMKTKWQDWLRDKQKAA